METASVSHDEKHQHAVISFADGLIEKMKAAGINVSTDWQEGERVLAQVNESEYVSSNVELKDQPDDSLSFSLVDSVNNQRGNANQHFIKDRNELSSDEKETQQKAWRAVFHSLSEVVSSSEMPRRTDVPGTSYSASKPNAGTNLGTLSGIIGQLNSAAKVRQNSEITKLSSKKELPPVTPLGTNRRGISKAAQTILAPRPFLSQRKINQLACQAREPRRSTKRKAHQPTFPICASSSSCSTSSRCCRKSASCSLSQMFMLSFFIIQSDKPYIMLITSL